MLALFFGNYLQEFYLQEYLIHQFFFCSYNFDISQITLRLYYPRLNQPTKRVKPLLSFRIAMSGAREIFFFSRQRYSLARNELVTNTLPCISRPF